MLLDILRADPAGNITVFVLDEVKKELRADIASKLMAMPKLSAEQVGFITAPLSSGCACRLEMMGGEFCGNASRALGLYLAQREGRSGSFLIEVSGAAAPVEVTADLEAKTASVSLPLPGRIEPYILSGVECTRVDMEGISHLIAESEAPDRRIITAADELFGSDPAIAAYGVMFFDKYSMSMTPFVRVKATGTLIREGSCGSGTAAAAVSLCLGPFEGSRSFSISQPAGVMTAGITKQNGVLHSITIGGAVSLGEPLSVEL